MARLESRAVMGYVPTPTSTLSRLRTILNLPPGLVALDPCCGTGEALDLLTPPDSLTYGVELDVDRGTKAKGILDHVLLAAMQDVRVANNAFGLVLLNPPYDDSVEGRLEFTMLERATNYLAYGGIMVYIIKFDRFSPQVLEHFGRYYDQHHHFRFDDPEFANFGQTVLIARRGTGYRTPAGEMRVKLGLAASDGANSLPTPLSTASVKIEVPKGKVPHTFAALTISEDALRAMLTASPLRRRPHPPKPLNIGRPPLPLKKGHTALVLASGACNGVYGEGIKRHVAKGSVRRVEMEEEEDDQTAGGKAILIRHRTFTFEVNIRCLTGDGVIHDVAGSPPAKHEDGQEDSDK